MERVNANGENVEEVLQEIHRLSLKDAEELNLDDVVKVRQDELVTWTVRSSQCHEVHVVYLRKSTL